MTRWCVIGAGGIADRRTIPAIMKDEDFSLVAVMDKSPEVAKRIGEKYGVPYFTCEDEMFASVKCDAVYIGTPVFCHKEQALTALKYGVNVLVEKPVCMTTEEGKELLDAFRAAGRQLTVGYMMKHHSLHERAKAIIAEGGVGKVVNVRAQFSCWYPDIPGAWRQTFRLGGGGAFMDLGVHCAELVEDILGEKIVEVKSLCATSSFKYEVEDSAIVIFRTESGVLGHIDVNFNIPDIASESKLEIYGDGGYIVCEGTLGQTESGRLRHLYAPQGEYEAMQNRKVGEPVFYEGDGGDLYVKQLRAFGDILASGENDYTFAERAVHIQELVDMIYADAGIGPKNN